MGLLPAYCRACSERCRGNYNSGDITLGCNSAGDSYARRCPSVRPHLAGDQDSRRYPGQARGILPFGLLKPQQEVAYQYLPRSANGDRNLQRRFPYNQHVQLNGEEKMQKDLIALVRVVAIALVWVMTSTSGVRAETIVFQEKFEDTDMSDWKPGTANRTISGWKIDNYRRALVMKFVDGGKEQKSIFRIEGVPGDTAFNMLSPSFEVKEGSRYTLRMLARHSYNISKLKGGDDWGGYLEWYDGGGNRLSRTRILGFDLPNEVWHRDEAKNLTAPLGAREARVRIGVDWPNMAVGFYWEMDDIEVVEEAGTQTTKAEITTLPTPRSIKLMDSPVLLPVEKLPSIPLGNQIANGDFEEGTENDTIPPGWKRTGWDGKDEDVKLSTQKVAHSGKAALALVSTTTEAIGGITQKIKVIPGQTYYYQAWVKIPEMRAKTTESVTTAFTIGTLKRYINMGIKEESRNWKPFWLTLEIPRDVDEVELSLFIYHGKGTAYIDKVWFGDATLGRPQRKGLVAVSLPKKGNPPTAAECQSLLGKRGMLGGSFIELPDSQKCKLLSQIAPPPISQIHSYASVWEGQRTEGNFFRNRPHPAKVGGETWLPPVVLTMRHGQLYLQANAKGQGMKGWYGVAAELQGIPDKDIIVRNLTTGETYTYSPLPTRRNEYYVDKPRGHFTFGAPQKKGDQIELRFLYWRYSYIDPGHEIPDEEHDRRFTRDLLDLYCKNVTIHFMNYKTLDALEARVDELRGYGLNVWIYAYIGRSELKGFGVDKPDTVEVMRRVAARLKGKITQYVLGGELDASIHGTGQVGGKPVLFPDKYMEFAKSVAGAIRSADPQAKLFSFTLQQLNLWYAKELLDRGILDIVDGMGIDYYGSTIFNYHPEAPHKPYGKIVTYNRDEIIKLAQGKLAPLGGDYYDPYDINAFTKQWTAFINWMRTYRKDALVSIGEWGFDYQGNYCTMLPPIHPAPLPHPGQDRRAFRDALRIVDFIPPRGRYNSAIHTARHAILWTDLFAQQNLGGVFNYQRLHDTWNYGLSLINQWGERRPKYLAYQTINKLLYNPRKLYRPVQMNTLSEYIQSHIYLRNEKELIIILWAPYDRAMVDLILDDVSFKYPARVDLFDYYNLLYVKAEEIDGHTVIRGLEIDGEPYILRLIKAE